MIFFQRWTTNITRFPPRYILAILFTAHVVFTIQIITKYKLFLAEPWPRSLLFNVAPLFCEESHFSGPVLCSQHPPVDHPRGEPRGVLPGDVGGAGERSRIQHRVAQHRRSPLQQLLEA